MLRAVFLRDAERRPQNVHHQGRRVVFVELQDLLLHGRDAPRPVGVHRAGERGQDDQEESHARGGRDHVGSRRPDYAEPRGQDKPQIKTLVDFARAPSACRLR